MNNTIYVADPWRPLEATSAISTPDIPRILPTLSVIPEFGRVRLGKLTRARTRIFRVQKRVVGVRKNSLRPIRIGRATEVAHSAPAEWHRATSENDIR